MEGNIVSLNALEKAYGSRVVLGGVTLGIDAGDKVGLIGDNGTGKSTLLKIVAGAESPDAGTVATRGGLRIATLAQVPTFPEGVTVHGAMLDALAPVRQAIAAYEAAAARQDPAAGRLHDDVDRLGGYGYEHRMVRAAAELGLDTLLLRDVATLSGGEQKRVALAALWLSGADLMLLDEPTNHLDASTVDWLEAWLAESPATVVVVTHDRAFLEAVATRMVELRGGQLRTYSGGYLAYLEARATEEALAERTRERRLQILETELDWARRSPSARTTKQKARLGRVDDIAEEAERLKKTSKTAAFAFGDGPRLGRTVLALESVSKAYPGGPPLVAGITLALRRGERLGIVGPNGSGKTTLIRLITGEEAPDSGTIVRGVNTRFATFDQHRSAIVPGSTVREILAPDGGDYVFPNGEKTHVATWLTRFAFANDVHRQPVSALSGGERSRLAIARFLLTDANVLCLDEPTNDLDLFTLAVLEEALVQFAGCVLVVSHDRYFLDKVATGILAFERDLDAPGTVTLVQGDYTTYRRLRRDRLEAAKAERAPRPPPTARVPASSKKKLTWAEQKELEGLEARIEGAEAEVTRLEAELSRPELWAEDHVRALAVERALGAARDASTALFERWEALLAKQDDG